MTTLLTLSQIWPVTLLKARFSLTDSCTTNRFILPSTCCPLCLVWWRRLSKRTDLITPQCPTSCMQTMPLPRIQQPWKQSLVRKPSLKRITLTWNSWRDSRLSSLPKDNMNPEDFMTHSTWPGNFFHSILKIHFLRFLERSKTSSIREDWTKKTDVGILFILLYIFISSFLKNKLYLLFFLTYIFIKTLRINRSLSYKMRLEDNWL